MQYDVQVAGSSEPHDFIGSSSDPSVAPSTRFAMKTVLIVTGHTEMYVVDTLVPPRKRIPCLVPFAGLEGPNRIERETEASGREHAEPCRREGPRLPLDSALRLRMLQFPTR
jgi:hypothetical protein